MAAKTKKVKVQGLRQCKARLIAISDVNESDNKVRCAECGVETFMLRIPSETFPLYYQTSHMVPAELVVDALA